VRILGLLLIAQLGFQVAYAQDSAPNEAPYIQDDNEFDAFSNEAPPAGEETDAASIENDLKKKPEEKKETVDLNAPSDKKIEDDLILEDDNAPQIATPDEPAPYSEPVVEDVKPTKKVPRSSKISQSSKGGVEYIQHPQAAHGLIMIKKDGSYVYRTQEVKQHEFSGAFRFGMIDPPKITSAAVGNAGSVTYSDMYSGGSQPLLSFDFEWQPYKSFGKLGLQTGFGLLVANGKGRFIDDGTEAKEKYTFIAIPLNIGVTYRMEWMHRQWFAPYVSAGGTYIGVAEFRDDGKSPSFNGSPGAYGGGGLLLNISAVNRDTAFTLQSEYGITNLWVSLDYRYLATFNEDMDFSSSIIGAGIVCDY
jgi:hypothetical protein